MSSTTIKVSNKTRVHLDKEKLYSKESFDHVISRLLEYKYQDDILDEQTIKNIQEGLDDITSGKTFTTQQLKKELGL